MAAGQEHDAKGEGRTEDASCVTRARRASALTVGDAALITGMSQERYAQLEDRPLQMTVGELRALCRELNADGERVMREWFDGFFCL